MDFVRRCAGARRHRDRHGRRWTQRSSASSPTSPSCTRSSPPSWRRPRSGTQSTKTQGRGFGRRAPSPTSRRGRAAPARAAHAPPTTPEAASPSGPSRAATASAPRERWCSWPSGALCPTGLAAGQVVGRRQLGLRRRRAPRLPAPHWRPWASTGQGADRAVARGPERPQVLPQPAGGRPHPGRRAVLPTTSCAPTGSFSAARPSRARAAGPRHRRRDRQGRRDRQPRLPGPQSGRPRQPSQPRRGRRGGRRRGRTWRGRTWRG